MPLAALTALVLCLLAANSLLTRAGVAGGTDPLTFAAIRVSAGAAVLCALSVRRGIPLRGARRWAAGAALALYLIAFSLAYRTLDAGLGALILFATVQIALFALSLAGGERSGPVRLAGMALALAGLVWLLAPGGGMRASAWDVAAMVTAGLGWAGYVLAGRSEPQPLAGSAGNFVAATILMGPLGLLTWAAGGLEGTVTPAGAAMAVASGGIASGLGYAMLFRVLPLMGIATAGVAQLAVPVIAMAAGAGLLGEVPGARALMAGTLVLAGIGLATWRGRGRAVR